MTAPLTMPLPEVRGSLKRDVALAPYTWFRVGGPADALFLPADESDLSAFLAALPDTVPVTVIGVGSNVIVRDGGIDGVVVRLGHAFGQIVRVCDTRLRVGAAALDAAVAKAARQAGLEGLEFLSGIPGTMGGAMAMNAGAYGRELSDVLIEAVALDREGNRHVLAPDEMNLGYRTNPRAGELIFIEALVEGQKGDIAKIDARMAEIAQSRETTQPIRTRTGGSTFKNPGGASPEGPKAWKLIDEAGMRGAAHGEAQVSEKHCNFLVNTGAASASEIEALGEEVRAKVHARTGVELEWEIKRLGRADAPGRAGEPDTGEVL